MDILNFGTGNSVGRKLRWGEKLIWKFGKKISLLKRKLKRKGGQPRGIDPIQRWEPIRNNGKIGELHLNKFQFKRGGAWGRATLEKKRCKKKPSVKRVGQKKKYLQIRARARLGENRKELRHQEKHFWQWKRKTWQCFGSRDYIRD